METIIVGVSGGSGSGKSDFVNHLAQAIDPPPLVLALDHYYRDLSAMPPSARDHVNYDDPDAIEWDLLRKQLAVLRAGKPIDRPIYDFALHIRAGSVKVEPASIIILDGIFALCDSELVTSLDLRLYVECDADVRLARRMIRDSKTRGRSIEQVFSQFYTTVKPMHAKHIEPTKYFADLIVPWHERNPRAVHLIASIIKAI